jgi:hypothetical protein
VKSPLSCAPVCGVGRFGEPRHGRHCGGTRVPASGMYRNALALACLQLLSPELPPALHLLSPSLLRTLTPLARQTIQSLLDSTPFLHQVFWVRPNWCHFCVPSMHVALLLHPCWWSFLSRTLCALRPCDPRCGTPPQYETMRNYIFPAEFTPVFDYTFTDSDGGEPCVWMRVQT